MKKAIMYITICFLIFIGGVYFATMYIIPDQNSVTLPIKEPSSIAPEDSLKSQDLPLDSKSKGYKIKNYNGNIAVFNSESSSPLRITSVTVEELPPADQELLKKGIDVSSEEELITILEDYCS